MKLMFVFTLMISGLLINECEGFNPCIYVNCMHDTYEHPLDVYKAKIISIVGSMNGNVAYNTWQSGAFQAPDPVSILDKLVGNREGQSSYYKRDLGGGNRSWTS